MATIKGGEKLRAFLAALGDKVKQGATLRVGFMESATYPDGTPVAMIAAVQEFGAPKVGIPPRPFMRNAIAKHEGEWPSGFAMQLKATNYDVKLTFERAGAAIAGQIRQSIVDTNEPHLAPSTIKRKGFSKPLVATGHMLASVDFEVKVK